MTSSIASTSAPVSPLRPRLHDAWRRQAIRQSLRGVGWVLAAALSVYLAGFLLDRFLDLAWPTRALLLALLVLAAGYAVHRALLRGVERFSDVRLALRIERAHPQLQSILVSGVQFAAATGPDETGASAQLIAAVTRQAAQRASAIDFDKTLVVTGLRRALAAGVVLVALTVTVAAVRAQDLWVYSCRLFNPLSARQYATQTTIEATSGDLIVPAGKPVVLWVRTGGQPPAGATLHVRTSSSAGGSTGDWETLPAVRHDAREFRCQLDRVSDELTYWFTAGDAKSGRCRVRAVPPPRIVGQQIQLTYPAYMKKAPEASPSFNLKVPEGTTVTWDLTLDLPVTDAQLEVEIKDRPASATTMPATSATPVTQPRPEVELKDRPPLAMTISDGGRRVKAQALADASAPYKLRFTWLLNGRAMTDEGPRHFIQVSPDADPRTEIVYPQEDEKATLNKTVAISYWARDDYGLNRLWLVYSVNNGAEQRLELKDLAGQASVDDQAAWVVKKSLPELRIGDIVTYGLEVSDGRTGGPPHVGRSRSRRVQFVSDADYLAYVLTRQRKFLGQLRPLYLQERDAADRVGDLIGGPTTTTQPVEGKP